MDLKSMKLNQIVIVFIISIALISGTAFAVSTLSPILHGYALDGTASADGSIVTVYPQSNSSDNLTDIVGPNGNTNLSSEWKINLNNLNKDLQNGDVIVIKITNGSSTTTRTYTVNLADGAVNLSLNYNPAFQDYDNDNHFANVDCNDNNAAINPGATDVCGDGTDQDCN